MKRTEVQRKMRRVLGRMVHSLVSAALGAWSNVVDYDRASELAVHRVISRFRMRAIAQAWRAWAQTAIRNQIAAQKAQTEAELESDLCPKRHLC